MEIAINSTPTINRVYDLMSEANDEHRRLLDRGRQVPIAKSAMPSEIRQESAPEPSRRAEIPRR